MFYLHNLRVRLQERRNRLYKTDHITYSAELRYLLQFLHGNTYICSLLVALDANTSVDFEQWVTELFDTLEVQFPQNEKEEQRYVTTSLGSGATTSMFTRY